MVDPSLGTEAFCYVTTAGRVSGDPHTTEIWFALRGTTVYMLSGGRERSDWVKNMLKEPHVEVRIADRHFQGRGRMVEGGEEETWARRALVDKYQKGYSGDLTNWGRDSLPIAVDLEEAASSPG